MYKVTHISTSNQAEKIFNLLLLLYPSLYKKKYGNEMSLVFAEMYQEEITKNGHIGIEFWLGQIGDITRSVLEQHIDEIQKKGMKKYLQQTLHINKYNVIGFLFLVPFLLLFMIDLVSRIAQGDLMHYNRPVYHYLSQTPLYWRPILFSIVIIFPLFAIALNFIPLFQQKIIGSNWSFVRKNVITFIVILVAFGCISIIALHDFLPCMIQGILKGGLFHFSQMFFYCQKA